MRADEIAPILSASGIKKALLRIAHEVVEKNEDDQSVVVLGIQKGGVHLAARLASHLGDIWGHPVPAGLLDVSMHRDDLDQRLAPQVFPTSLPTDINSKLVIIVDDVLYSGRTARAAMDALHDFGRPRAIQLAVLIDRGARELPIKADFVGKIISTDRAKRINVRLKEAGGDDTVTVDTE